MMAILGYSIGHWIVVKVGVTAPGDVAAQTKECLYHPPLHQFLYWPLHHPALDEHRCWIAPQLIVASSAVVNMY